MRHEIRLELVGGLLAAGSLFGIGVAPVLAAATSVTPCVLPADLTRLDRPLKRTAHHLASGDLIVIVALGSSSTAGAGASSAAATYPSRLAVELTQRFPSQPIMVLNRGISGERAIDMLARFDKSVVAEHPDLVLWQVGTNSVLRGYEHSLSNSLIHDGIRRMKAIGADVVLIDPQFAPKVIVKPEIEDMVDLISTAAKQENVDLFHRFALMRHWHEVNDMPFETFVSTDGLHMNDWSYSCIGKALADAITDAVTRPPSVTVSLSAGPSARGMPGYLSHWQLLTQLKSCAGSGSATERSSLASLLAFSASLRSPGAVVHEVGSVIV